MIRACLFILSLILALPHGVAIAGDAALAERYAAERQTVERLSASNAAADRRQLGAMLLAGLMTGPDNPLRRPDREAAKAAYGAAFARGDRTAETAVALARLRLAASGPGFRELEGLLRRLMFQGNGEAAHVLALAAGQGAGHDPDEARQLLESAAVMGSVGALTDLAESGEKAALPPLRARAEAGSPRAMLALANIHREGRLVPADPIAALDWLQRAAEAGSLPAMVRYAGHLQRGENVAADPARALDMLRKAADAGSVDAALALGRTAQTDEKRLWLARAAEAGNSRAGLELHTLDLAAALAFRGDTAERQARIGRALEPIAADPEALTKLAGRALDREAAPQVAPVLLPLLRDAALTGNVSAGLALDAWLRAARQVLPADVASALADALRRAEATDPRAGLALAALSLDGRLGEAVGTGEAVERLFAAADNGIGEAMLRIARMYAHGNLPGRSPLFARRWYETAAAAGVDAASWELAALRMRDSDPAGRAAAERFYLKKLDEGDMRAALALVARALKSGPAEPRLLAPARETAKRPADFVALARTLAATGRDGDLAEARRVLAQALAAGPDPEAQALYGLVLTRGDTAGPERREGLALLEREAAAGSRPARLALASALLSSGAFAARHAEAVGLLDAILADEPHDVPARLLLARAYFNGRGVTRDTARGAEIVAAVRAEGAYDRPGATLLEAEWLAAAPTQADAGADPAAMLEAQADRGSVQARTALGLGYLAGLGGPLDTDRAAVHLSEAAANGDRDAMAAFGHLLVNGHGIRTSRAEGQKWLTRAADAGNLSAVDDLSRAAGSGTDKAAGARVAAWLRRAAERGHADAAFQIGTAYLKGAGVGQNDTEAARWLEQAAGAGNQRAARMLKTLAPAADEQQQASKAAAASGGSR
ncbi:hypothetical protein ACFFJ7_12080 [Pseudochelatococcus lubricantis]|uniref:hypothetical protein n=1 Tax=Pseudochelatococcus lubricantis TaxID=1538102 RepID=UPI0035EFA0DD